MQRLFGPRALFAICGAFVILLTALAAVQYRWSSRVAAADTQREKEHLDTAASLFASEFNGIATKAVEFMQNDAWSAKRSGQRLADVPKFLSELYWIDMSAKGAPQAQKLNSEGLFDPSPMPAWLTIPRCASIAIERPAALVAPVYQVNTQESRGAEGMRLVKTFEGQADRCFVGVVNETYLRGSLIPDLIRKSFGPTSVDNYDFAITSRNREGQTVYGAPIRADLRTPFFALPLLPFPSALTEVAVGPGAGPSTKVFVQHRENVVVRARLTRPDLFGSGIWELQVGRKGMPLAAAFEQTRRRNLMLSVAVEALLLVSLVFLVVAVRRMQRVADQKMQFVAAVSHELRTPVSAISMLSRNQADGLVAGGDKVKQYGELIHQQSRRLSEMVEQTLQYAGIYSGLRQPTKNEVDLHQLIRQTVDERREELARGGFEVELNFASDVPPVTGDTQLLRTAFDNLLSNAQKYANGGRWIRVSTSYSAAQREVRVSVEDRGPGIDAVDQAEIFEPFYRGTAAIEAQIPGSGLGLSLVRTAVEAHHGTVTLVSDPGRGSTFTMHLPV